MRIASLILDLCSVKKMDNVNEWEELVKIVPVAILTFSQTPTVREIESL